MTTYRIEYKWRENDYGQSVRPWQHAYSLVKGESQSEAVQEFKGQDWKVEYEICFVYKCYDL